MSFAREFTEFLEEFKVTGLAVAFIMGAAAGKLITAIVNDAVMPVVGVLTPGGDWKAFVLSAGPFKFPVGDLASSLLDFLMVAFVLFFLINMVMNGALKIKKKR